MRNDMGRYIIGFLVAVGLIVVVIVLLVRSLVSTPSSTTPQPIAPHSTFTDYAGTTTTVQFTIDSPVVAPEKHHDVIINVGTTATTLTITQGYEGQVLKSQTYHMDDNAYANFLHALKVNGFTLGDKSASLKDERGQCALGRRYIYQTIGGDSQDIQRFWSTSCGSGTFQGNASSIRELFIRQVPDYDKQTRGLSLTSVS